MTNRTVIDIYADILEAAQKGMRKTTIMYHANIPFFAQKRCLKVLCDAGLIARQSPLFKTTESGHLFLQHYRAMKQLLNNGKRRWTNGKRR